MRNIGETPSTAPHTALLRNIDSAVKAVLPGSSVILFGSRARGDAADDSDWDILVIAPSIDWRLERRLYSQLFKIELDENIIINVVAVARVDWEANRYRGHPMKRNIEKEGILVA